MRVSVASAARWFVIVVNAIAGVSSCIPLGLTLLSFNLIYAYHEVYSLSFTSISPKVVCFLINRSFGISFALWLFQSAIFDTQTYLVCIHSDIMELSMRCQKNSSEGIENWRKETKYFTKFVAHTSSFFLHLKVISHPWFVNGKNTTRLPKLE